MISYNTATNDGSYGFGRSVAKLNDGEMLTPEVLDTICGEIKEANDLKNIVILAFSEFDREDT